MARKSTERIRVAPRSLTITNAPKSRIRISTAGIRILRRGKSTPRKRSRWKRSWAARLPK
jgi:hypothetical protein